MGAFEQIFYWEDMRTTAREKGVNIIRCSKLFQVFDTKRVSYYYFRLCIHSNNFFSWLSHTYFYYSCTTSLKRTFPLSEHYPINCNRKLNNFLLFADCHCITRRQFKSASAPCRIGTQEGSWNGPCHALWRRGISYTIFSFGTQNLKFWYSTLINSLFIHKS